VDDLFTPQFRGTNANLQMLLDPAAEFIEILVVKMPSISACVNACGNLIAIDFILFTPWPTFWRKVKPSL